MQLKQQVMNSGKMLTLRTLASKSSLENRNWIRFILNQGWRTYLIKLKLNKKSKKKTLLVLIEKKLSMNSQWIR